MTVVYWMSREISSLFLHMTTVGPDSTISDTFLQLLAQITLSYEQFSKIFAVLLVKNHGFLAPRLGIRGI